MENEIQDEMLRVTVVKTTGGEYYIGHSLEEGKKGIILKDPRILVTQVTPNGQPAIMAVPPYYFLKNQKLDYIEIPACACIEPFMKEDDIDNKLVSGYKSEITGIKIPSKPDIII